MKQAIKLGSILFLLNLFVFVLYYFIKVPNDGLIIFGIRVLGCCYIGLWFASQNPKRSTHTKKAVLISVAALIFGIYYLLMLNPALYTSLFDIVWWGAYEEAFLPNHPIRIFVGESLFDRFSVFAYMCLIISLQLKQLRLAKKAASVPST